MKFLFFEELLTHSHIIYEKRIFMLRILALTPSMSSLIELFVAK